MILSMIVAIGKNREIGKNNNLLWHISEDLKNFKSITTGRPIIMGRKTFESLGRPLPKRENIVLTRDESYHPEGTTVFHDIDSMMSYLNQLDNDEAIIIGGGVIYETFLPKIDRLYLTTVDWEGEADTFFPEIPFTEFRITEHIEHKATEKAPAWDFKILER
jgi:dihydrofolate reductase